MEAVLYAGFGGLLLLAAFLLFQAGGRFLHGKLDRQVAELRRQVDSMEQDFARHKKRDAADASNSVPHRRPSRAEEAQPSWEELKRRDPQAARALIVRTMNARDNGGS